MSFKKEQLNSIYDKTSGKCHLCGKKLARTNYGVIGARGAWEIEHSIPRIAGGTDHGNNLYPAHIRCNRSKRDMSTRAIRARHGRSRAPLSVEKRKQAKVSSALTWGAIGGVVAMVFAPELTLIGAIVSAVAGYNAKVD